MIQEQHCLSCNIIESLITTFFQIFCYMFLFVIWNFIIVINNVNLVTIVLYTIKHYLKLFAIFWISFFKYIQLICCFIYIVFFSIFIKLKIFVCTKQWLYKRVILIFLFISIQHIITSPDNISCKQQILFVKWQIQWLCKIIIYWNITIRFW